MQNFDIAINTLRYIIIGGKFIIREFRIVTSRNLNDTNVCVIERQIPIQLLLSQKWLLVSKTYILNCLNR